MDYNPTDADLVAAWAHVSDADFPAALIAIYPIFKGKDDIPQAIADCAKARERISKLRGFA